jgi:hypothetical protein
VCGDFRNQLDFDGSGSASRSHVLTEAPRELLLVIPDREAEGDPNVSPITFQLSGFDGLGGSERRCEIWVLIFFDQCAKFGGRHGGHKVFEMSAGTGGPGILAKFVPAEARIGWLERDMWHNFCNRVGSTKDGRLASFRSRTP